MPREARKGISFVQKHIEAMYIAIICNRGQGKAKETARHHTTTQGKQREDGG